MITQRKVFIYKKFYSFIEGYMFHNNAFSDADFTVNDWTTIDQIIGDIILLKSGNASFEYEEKIKKALQQQTEDRSVIELLEEMADQKIAKSKEKSKS
jgi:hypothetical protein